MASPEVSIITCTGDRPEAFRLCCHYMARQRFGGQIEWIVVSDGGASPEVAPVPMWETRVIRRQASELPKESFRANMLAAVDAARSSKILIVEDDDWYHPDYVGMMAALLDLRPLVGGMHARYYNVRHRSFMTHQNRSHASLCTTGFRRDLLPMVRKILVDSNFTRPENPQQLDGTLWKRSGIADQFKLLLPISPHVVGIKGMPGRAGLGIHHRENELAGYTPDPDLFGLRTWIGEDADSYAGFRCHS